MVYEGKKTTTVLHSLSSKWPPPGICLLLDPALVLRSGLEWSLNIQSVMFSHSNESRSAGWTSSCMMGVYHTFSAKIHKYIAAKGLSLHVDYIFLSPHANFQICLFTVPLRVHIIAFVKLVFNHLVTTDPQRWANDGHPCQRNSEKTQKQESVFCIYLIEFQF